MNADLCSAPDPPSIKGDGVTQLLYERYLCSYLLYDYNLSHANHCFFNSEYERDLRAAKKAKASPLDGRSWDQQLTRAYNHVLSEDIEALISHIQRCGAGSRAQIEVLIAKMMEEYKNNFKQMEENS